MSMCEVCPAKGLGEVWREIPVQGTRFRYEVSTHGRVRTILRSGFRYLKIQSHSTGYQVVNLGRANRCRYVHRLVALAFLGDPPVTGRTMEVDHLDFDRHHNVVTNLRWLPKDVNAWRWKFWLEEEPPDLYDNEQDPFADMTDDEYRALGWGPAERQVWRPDERHRHAS